MQGLEKSNVNETDVWELARLPKDSAGDSLRGTFIKVRQWFQEIRCFQEKSSSWTWMGHCPRKEGSQGNSGQGPGQYSLQEEIKVFWRNGDFLVCCSRMETLRTPCCAKKHGSYQKVKSKGYGVNLKLEATPTNLKQCTNLKTMPAMGWSPSNV